jgi:hypothetical protein
MHYKGYPHYITILQHLTEVAKTAVPVHTIKACGGVDIHINSFSFCTRWRPVVSFILWPLTPPTERIHSTHLTGELEGPRADENMLHKEKNVLPLPGPYLRKGQRGLGPGQQISRGGILKNLRLKYGMRGKKRLSTREKFKGDLY